MDAEFLSLLRDPIAHEPLDHIRDGKREFLSSRSGRRYEIDAGIVRFLDAEELTGNNKRYQRLYDRLAPVYDLSTRIYARVKQGNVDDRIGQYLKELDVKDGQRVIEISVGTGRNLVGLNHKAAYFGVDISFGMMKRCARAMRRSGRRVSLVQAEAELLPLKDGAFDVVFSAGGFNFFNDKSEAVREMLRIAKSGTKLMISDETEKIRAKFDKSPVTKAFYGNQDKIAGPAAFIPDGCRDVEYKEVCDGELYALTFWKP